MTKDADQNEQGARARFVGQCIYCGALPTNMGQLTDEHIIALALGGKHVLGKASCDKCAKITSAIETKVLRDDLGAMRAAVGFPTRHKKKRPTTATLDVRRLGEWESIEVPIDDYCPVIAGPIFDPPAYVDKRDYEGGIKMVGYYCRPAKREHEAIAKKYEAEGLAVTSLRNPEAWARMLAKIAYGTAVWKYGLAGIKTAFILDAILGSRDDIGMWVGCDGMEIPAELGTHGHTVVVGRNEGMIFARVKLFDFVEAAEYLVVVGEAA
jgi:hypothetical protein